MKSYEQYRFLGKNKLVISIWMSKNNFETDIQISSVSFFLLVSSLEKKTRSRRYAIVDVSTEVKFIYWCFSRHFDSRRLSDLYTDICGDLNSETILVVLNTPGVSNTVLHTFKIFRSSVQNIKYNQEKMLCARRV